MKNIKINIGCGVYEIHFDSLKTSDEIWPKDMCGSLAYVDSSLSTIHICADYPIQTMKQSFFHEIVHAMLNEIGADDLNDNEGFVEAFARQLYTFFSKNDINKILSKIDDNHESKKNSA